MVEVMIVLLNGWHRRTARLATAIMLLAGWMAMAGCAYEDGADTTEEVTAGGVRDPLPDASGEETAADGTEDAAEASEPSPDERSEPSGVRTATPPEPEVVIDYRQAVSLGGNPDISPSPGTKIIGVRPGNRLTIDEAKLRIPVPEKQHEPMSGMLATTLEVEQGEELAKIRMTLRNISGRDLKLTSSSGQRYEIVVTDEQGNNVYQWSMHFSFISMIIDWELAADESVTYEEEWSYVNDEGDRLAPGTYVVRAVILARLPSGEAIDPVELTAETKITIR